MHPSRLAPSAPRLTNVLLLAAAIVASVSVTATAHAQRTRDTIPDSVRSILRASQREARDAVRARDDSAATRRPVTDELLSSAFADPEARTLLMRARAARLAQDSALTSYRARTTQRMSLGLGVRRVGLEKLLFRGDNVAMVSWRRDAGVWVRPIGSRITVPMASDATGEIVDAVSIPYFPGKESLWIPSSNFGVVRADVDDRELVHPIAGGAEAYYRYATGDSLRITLPDGRNIRLRELRITARRPEWRLFVGSFWFDKESGQLVRAAYRLAVDIEIWDVAGEESERDRELEQRIAVVRDSILRERLSPDEFVRDSARRARRTSSSDDDEPPGWLKASLRPARASLDAVTVEYGLYAGRFWLPRANSASFSAQLGPMRAPFTIDEKFDYEVVNGDFFLPPVPAARTAADSAARDSIAALASADSAGAGATRDSTGRVVSDDPSAVNVSVTIGGGEDARARRDSVERARRCAPTDSTYTRTESRYGGALRVAYDMPCDRSSLQTSAELPSLSTSTEELFDGSARDDLIAALGLNLQPAWGPRAPTFRSGLDLWRYNRVEGLSVGVLAEQVLGAGYTARAEARLGHADLEFNGEVGLARSNGRRTAFVNAYRRLDATAPEWGNPLSFGPSLPAILYARDEGFYYRSLGVEVGEEVTRRRGSWRWRLFHEQQRTAGDSTVLDTWSLGRVLGIGQFRSNFDAAVISVTGVGGEWSRAYGSNPVGFQLATTVRAEGGTGTVTYGRGALELVATKPVRNVALALSSSVGSSVGDVPPQRGWFLGGLRTVRGNPPGSAFGDAFWFSRAEMGTKFGAARPVVFYDAGWAGSRDTFGQGRTLQGAGAGLSLLDGLIRMDVARNLARGGGWRTDLYFQAPI